ncbi:MAG: metallophosphoesterase [Flavipsychrobacter sp.]|jgi:hypothetical protein|nr:metallophosphoesterase [Flavipsychrobacter sp.]
MKLPIAITALLLSGFTCLGQADSMYTAIAGTKALYITPDSVLTPASIQYQDPSWLRRTLLGRNYREEWSVPVKLKVFDLSKEMGGLKITEIGGGKQTLSATLVDKNGREWKLRTVDKDPAKVIPENFRNSVAESIIQDMISASHPYAPLAIPTLSAAANIPSSNPKFYFVADDTSFGRYSKLFANTVCILEEKDATGDSSETKSTAKVIENIFAENDHLIDQRTVLNARMLDILIADFDRHFDQWRWGVIDTGKGKVYYAVPRDRDQAFFYTDGLLPRYLSLKRMPFIKGLRYDIPKINWLSYPARDFDRLFLNGLEKNDWVEVITNMQASLTDTVIDQAVRQLPAEVYDLSGQKISAKLKSRRNLLLKAGLKYHAFLAKKVNIAGSDQRERFKLSDKDNALLVEVFSLEDSDTQRLIYSREFDGYTTKELRLYGLAGNDEFQVNATAQSQIKLRLLGGTGNDAYDLKGKNRKHIYDFTDEDNNILNKQRTNKHLSSDSTINQFNYHEYKYTQLYRFPYVTGGYNADDGVLLGLGFEIETYGFKKEPFASNNNLSFLYALANKAYKIKYTGTFTDAMGKIDVMPYFEFQNPALFNFFGLGNETQKDPDKDMFYYRTRFKYISADILGAVDPAKNFRISLGPSFYRYWNSRENNRGKIIETPEVIGLDSQSVYTTLTYAGARAILNFNTVTDKVYPANGVDWSAEFQHVEGLTKQSDPFTVLRSDAALYNGWLNNDRLVSIFRIGGAHIFSDNFEYFQAVNLGANNYLRGFRKNRFSGRSLAYNNIELRYKLANVRSYILPGTIGVIGFNDIGRVWMTGESSRQWHHAYGGGLFYIPYNLLIVGATIGVSNEETLINISFGTKLNLIF